MIYTFLYKKVFFIFFVFINPLYFQAQIVAKGIILDSVNHQPISYANIQIMNTMKGTISNAEGYFSLPINKAADSIQISYIGYKKKKILASDLVTDTIQNLLLSPQNFVISDIDVLGYRAEQLLREALLKIPQNYITTPSGQRSYFREIISNNGVAEKFSDANILIRKEPYNTLKADKMRFLAGRNHKNLKKSPMWDYIFFINGTYEVLHCDALKYKHSFILIPDNTINFLNPKKFKFYNYKIKFESEDIYLIEFAPQKRRAIYKGQIIVDKTTKAILAIFYYIVPSRLEYVSLINYDTEEYLNSNSILVKPVDYYAYVIYENWGDKYSLKQAGLKYQSLFYSNAKHFVSNISVVDQLVITHIDTLNVPKISIFKQIARESSIHEQIHYLNKKSVDTFTIIQPEKKILKFLQH